jgi:hypothetical protein
MKSRKYLESDPTPFEFGGAAYMDLLSAALEGYAVTDNLTLRPLLTAKRMWIPQTFKAFIQTPPQSNPPGLDGQINL